MEPIQGSREATERGEQRRKEWMYDTRRENCKQGHAKQANFPYTHKLNKKQIR
jgi:hypothetical protein